MNNTKRAMLIWMLGAVVVSLVGIYIPLTSDGAWYSIVSAAVLFLASAAFAARAVLTLRSSS